MSERNRRLTREQARIRDAMLIREPPDELTKQLAEGVRKGWIGYEASTGRYTLTAKGEYVLYRHLKRLNREVD